MYRTNIVNPLAVDSKSETKFLGYSYTGPIRNSARNGMRSGGKQEDRNTHTHTQCRFQH